LKNSNPKHDMAKKITIEQKLGTLWIVRDGDLYTEPVSAVEALAVVAATLAPHINPVRCHLKTAYEHKKFRTGVQNYLKLDNE